MRIVVISDSHGAVSPVEKAIEAQTEAGHVFFLGDGLKPLEHLPFIFSDRQFYFVEGNCDFVSSYKSSDVVVLEGRKVFFTHGHNYNVKYNLNRLIDQAKALKCDIALYGHTHTPQVLYEDGIYIVNPGSISRSRQGRCSYATIDLGDAGIVPNIIYV